MVLRKSGGQDELVRISLFFSLELKHIAVEDQRKFPHMFVDCPQNPVDLLYEIAIR